MSSNPPSPEASAARPLNNLITGSVAANWSPGGAAPDDRPAFAIAVDTVLRLTAEIARNFIGAHQSAATLIVSEDWQHARKWFSLSEKYSPWYEYRAPAVGFGLHALVVHDNKPLRLTNEELEAHPGWHGFGSQATSHPPMRGWLAVPLIGIDGHNYGLLQLSDKYDDADFTLDDEQHLTQLAQLTATTLDLLRASYPEQGLGQAAQK
ncbi:MAG TPA: GAF domain-containing protein [Ktedonobacteraceae bacterium]